MQRQLLLLGLVAMLLLAVACKGRKAHPTEGDLRGMDKEKAIAGHRQSHLHFKVLTFKGKADFEDLDKGSSIGFGYRIDIAKDSLILINLSKFGLPAMSMLLARDTVRMRIPLNNSAAICDYKLVRKMIGLDFEFKTFQNLLLGDADLDKEVTLTSGKANPIVLQGSQPPYSVSWILNGRNYRLEKMLLSDPILAKESAIAYSGFEKIEGQMVASMLQVEVTQPQKLRILLHHSGIALDKEKVDFRFRIPASYKIMPCDSLAQAPR